MRLVPFLAIALIGSGCATGIEPTYGLNGRETTVAVFNGATDTIRVDRVALTIAIGTTTHPLEDCSTDEHLCLKNETLGFHVVFPRSCVSGYQDVESAGGYSFTQISMEEHGAAQEGGYVSTLSDRFAYRYMIERGLYQIRYDPSGQVRFGPGSASHRLGLFASESHTYRLVDGLAFLRCTGAAQSG